MVDNKNYIQVHIDGIVGIEKLSPKNYDIRELKQVLECMDDLLSNGDKKNRSIITYQMHEGSVINRFFTNPQKIVEIAAVLSLISSNGSLKGLTSQTAKAIDGIQKIARVKNYTFDFSTSENEGKVALSINANTEFVQDDDNWVNGEFYFYGIVVDAGGKKDANIHLDVDQIGVLTIASQKEYLEKQEKNLLYHSCGVRVYGKQNLSTGEIDKKNMELIELIDYSPRFDENYLNSLIKKASKSWEGVDSDEFLKNLRGGYEYV